MISTENCFLEKTIIEMLRPSESKQNYLNQTKQKLYITKNRREL